MLLFLLSLLLFQSATVCIKSFYQLYYLTNKLDQKYSARPTLQNYYTLVQIK